MKFKILASCEHQSTIIIWCLSRAPENFSMTSAATMRYDRKRDLSVRKVIFIIFRVGGRAGFQPSFRRGERKKSNKIGPQGLRKFCIHIAAASIRPHRDLHGFFATICTSSVVASPRFPDFRTTMLGGRLFCLSLSSSSRVPIVLPHANRVMRRYYYRNHHYCYHRDILLLSWLLQSWCDIVSTRPPIELQRWRRHRRRQIIYSKGRRHVTFIILLK